MVRIFCPSPRIRQTGEELHDATAAAVDSHHLFTGQLGGWDQYGEGSKQFRFQLYRVQRTRYVRPPPNISSSSTRAFLSHIYPLRHLLTTLVGLTPKLVRYEHHATPGTRSRSSCQRVQLLQRSRPQATYVVACPAFSSFHHSGCEIKRSGLHSAALLWH